MMKTHPRFYYTIGILIALCATAMAKIKRQDNQRSQRFSRNGKAFTNEWGSLAFELESPMNQEDAFDSQD
jgi:hypothetical protein